MDQMITGSSRFSLKSLLVLAWRNLWRNPKRTIIMLAAITISVWAMIFMTALMRGMVEDMVQRGLDQLPGHVQVHHPAYLDDPSVVNSIQHPKGRFAKALQSPLVNRWFSRVKVPAVISSERDSRGVRLLGVDPDLERDSLFASMEISDGRFLASATDPGLVIGRRLAERLETQVGKRVVLMSQDRDNNLVEMGLRVIGLYEAEFASQEEVFAYVGKAALQQKLNIVGLVTEIAVFGDDFRTVDPVLQTVLANRPNTAAVQPWFEIDGYLGSMLSVMDGFVLVWIVVLFLALSFGLANTLVMAVFERVREIGLMLALGMRPLLILWQILIESVLLLVVGLIIGNALGVSSIALVADGIDISGVADGLEMAGMGTVLYPLLLTKDLLTANCVVLLLGLLTCFFPAWQAAHYDPIRALNKPT